MIDMGPHQLDDTLYCVRCGASAEQLYRQPRYCVEEGSNVVAISHTICAARLRKLAEKAEKPVA